MLVSHILASSTNALGVGIVVDIHKWFARASYIVRTNSVVRHRTLLDDLFAFSVACNLNGVYIQDRYVHDSDQLTSHVVDSTLDSERNSDSAEGVVGTLQFDVFEYRMKNEYGVDLRMESLPYEEIRLIENYPGELSDLNLGSDAELLEDYRGRSLLVFSSFWAIDFTVRRNPGLELKEIVVEEG